MSNIDKHLFQFTGNQIAHACKAEVSYRKARVEHWLHEQAQLVARAEGLTAVVRVRKQDFTGGTSYQVIADITDVQDINSRLHFCGMKLAEHRKAIEEYELKGAAYDSQGARFYELDPTDVSYFKLNGAKRSD